MELARRPRTTHGTQIAEVNLVAHPSKPSSIRLESTVKPSTTATALCLLSGSFALALNAQAAPAQAAAQAPVAEAPTATGATAPAAPVAEPPSAADAPTPAAAPTAAAPAAAAPTPRSADASSLEASPYEAPLARPTQEKPKDPNAPATLFGSTDYAIGGFGGLGVSYTRFAGKNVTQVCGEGALVLDHALTLGAGGCGLAPELKAEQYGPGPHNPRDRMSFGYGGAIVRYHFMSRSLVNFAVGALVGAGGLSIGTWDGSGDNWEKDYTHKHSDAVFVFEPQVGAYANFTRWLRFGAVASYRVVSGVNTQGLSNGDVSGFSLGGQLQAGWF